MFFSFKVGWFANPLFGKKGNWPKIMIDRIANNSAVEGLPESRLPTLSQQSIDFVRGAADFLGFNIYSSQLVEDMAGEYDPHNPSYKQDRFVIESVDPSWHSYPIPNEGFHVVPKGIRGILKYVKCVQT